MKKIIIYLSVLCNLISLSAFEPIEKITQKQQEIMRLEQTTRLLDLIKHSPELFDLLKHPNAQSIIFTLHTAIADFKGSQAPTIDQTKNVLATKIRSLNQCVNKNSKLQKAAPVQAQPTTGRPKFGFDVLQAHHNSGKRKHEEIESDSDVTTDEDI